jgi:hypothetical protein
VIEDLIVVGVDGVQSTAFSLDSNLAVIGASKDAAGQSPFWKLGTGTNLDVNEFFMDLREQLGQDLPQGVWPFIAAPLMNTIDPDNQTGVQFLRTAPSGWPDYHYLFQFTAVSTVASARTEVHEVV